MHFDSFPALKSEVSHPAKKRLKVMRKVRKMRSELKTEKRRKAGSEARVFK